ncbi:transposase domain-containing protein [Niastella koreensis]|uniref:transposase domain-containing protein n=1 Tax=Niastella koreensis TaxID=354356 RepID=UPI000D2F3F84
MANNEYIIAAFCAASCEPAKGKLFRPTLCKALHNVGRKNYLFCGSHEAAKRAGLLYSLLVSCKLNNVNPYEWLKDVLSHNINELTTSKLKSLLPHRWKKQESNTAA